MRQRGKELMQYRDFACHQSVSVAIMSELPSGTLMPNCRLPRARHPLGHWQRGKTGGENMYRSILRTFLFSSISLAFTCSVSAQVCVDCHKKVTPRVVSDWQISKHGQNGIACPICHGDKHTSSQDVAEVQLPTPDTCGKCHDKQVKQYKNGKHALAWAAMKAMPTIHWQPMALIEGMKGCGGCHKIGMKSEEEIKELKRSGQIFGNAACDSCHTRHTFSVQEAKQPQACQTCHTGFDHPQ